MLEALQDGLFLEYAMFGPEMVQNWPPEKRHNLYKQLGLEVLADSAGRHPNGVELRGQCESHGRSGSRCHHTLRDILLGGIISAPNALVAQPDRASDYESEGRRFESCRARYKLPAKRWNVNEPRFRAGAF